MPILILDGATARDNLRSNDFARWPSRFDKDNRIEPMARPAISPSFKFQAGARIFTIGSCFARNIERALVEHGFDVPSLMDWNDPMPGKSMENTVLNNYGVAAIENELTWALEPGSFKSEDHIVEVLPGRYCDLHIAMAVPLCSFDEALARRHRIRNVTQMVATSDVLVMTLGLAEVWKDLKSGYYLNARPPGALLRSNPDRFELHVLSYEDVIGSLRRIKALLDKHCPKLKKILSVSPVPLGATYTTTDVCVANCYSKSVLRAAASEICSGPNGFEYFPSYESIMLSNRDVAWQDDLIHPRLEIIDANVKALVHHYVSSELDKVRTIDTAGVAFVVRPASDEQREAIQTAEEQLKSGHIDGALLLARTLIDTPVMARAALVVGKALVLNGHPDQAVEIYRSVIAEKPASPFLHAGLSAALYALGMQQEAISAMKLGLDHAPEQPNMLLQICDLLLGAGKNEEAAIYFDRLKALNAESQFPLKMNQLSLTLNTQGNKEGAGR